MDKEYKLYRDGTFFDLRRDPFEEQPPVQAAGLTGAAASAAKKLSSVMDSYADARPAHLRGAAARKEKASPAKKK